MSDITLDFIVSNNNISITPFSNELVITPTAIDFNVYTNGGLGTPTSLNANISNVHISGGLNGQYIQTDGAGNLIWSSGGGSGNGVVGGSNTQVQFNDNGNFGGDTSFTFNKTSKDLGVTSANISNVVITGSGINTPGYYGDITGGNLFSAYTMNASVGMNTPNLTANIVTANFIQGSPTISVYSNISSGYDITVANLTSTGTALVYGNLVSTDNITASNGIGFSAGAGGVIYQSGSRTAGVTLSKPTGQITLYSASLAANTSSTFVLTNTFIRDTDMVIVEHVSGGTLGKYNITASPATGSATITLRNNSASASPTEQPVLKFIILRAVIS